MSAMPQMMEAGDGALAAAAALLQSGAIVAVPTETVYGLAADAENGKAVARIFEAKGRPQFNPLICHVDGLAMAQRYGRFNETALKLADAFWPGPLTIVVPLAEDCALHPLVTAGLGTVGLRQPKGVAAQIITALGRPLAAPSANASGKISPTTAQAVAASLGSKVPLILDDGPCAIGLESTIVAVNGEKVTLLRPGGIAVEEIEALLGAPVLHAGADAGVQAPGMMASHYAPDAAMRLDAHDVGADEALLAFGPDRIAGQPLAMDNLSPAGDLVEAAANLFAMLAALDATGAARIAVEPIPEHGLGAAINDRLRRAAAPRGTP